MSADVVPYQLRGQAGSREVDSRSWRASSGFSASNLRHGARLRSSAQRSARRVEAGIEVAQKRVLRWRQVSELDASALNEPWWDPNRTGVTRCRRGDRVTTLGANCFRLQTFELIRALIKTSPCPQCNRPIDSAINHAEKALPVVLSSISHICRSYEATTNAEQSD